MGTILIGNIKGPQGSQGIQGPQGPVGPVGPTGPGADIYNGLDQTEAGVAGLDSYQGRVLDQKKLDVAKVANNLTTAGEGYALDARQGKALDEKKLNVNNVVNNLTTTSSGYALDARQGKALNDALNTPASLVDGNFAEQSIISYQSASNVFTAPSDGYVMVNHNVTSVNAGNTISVFINGKQLISLFARGYGARGSIFVKKNAKVYHMQTGFTAGTNYWIMFYPFIYNTR